MKNIWKCIVDRGYVKLYRKSVDSRVFANDALWKVWCWCLMKASHKETWVSIPTGRGQTEIKLQPGQFIFGRKVASKKLKMKPSSIRNRIEKLKNMRNLDIQPDTHFSIITIRNWDTYNGEEKKVDSKVDRQRTTKGQPKDTYKHLKHLKNKEPSDFDKFWKAYPKKKSKGQAEKTWKKLHRGKKLPNINIIISAIRSQKSSPEWLKDAGQFIPYPSTWLNGECWNDEVAHKKRTPYPYKEQPAVEIPDDIISPEKFEEMRKKIGRIG